jgi:hypothetical protein
MSLMISPYNSNTTGNNNNNNNKTTNNSDNNNYNNKNDKMRDTTSDGDEKLKSLTQSPGGAKSAYAKRTWSPHQANMSRRKKVDGAGDQSTLNDSFGQLSLANLHGDNDEEEEDYLAKSLSSIKSLSSSHSSLGGLKSPNPRDRSGGGGRRTGGRRPSGSTPAAQPSLSSSKASSSSKSLPPSSSSRRLSSNKTRTKNSTTGSSRSLKTKTKQELMDEIPNDIKHKLYKMSDPELSIKERVLLELDMMKTSPEEKRILLKFKRNFERKLFIDYRDETQQNVTNKIQSDIRKEQKREDEFLLTLEEKHKQERHIERERLRREQQVEDDARAHKANIISRDMTIIKDAALEAATISVERNQKEKQREIKKVQKRIDDLRNSEEGKKMSGGQRALKEALIEQKVLPSTKLKEKKNKKKKMEEEESN